MMGQVVEGGGLLLGGLTFILQRPSTAKYNDDSICAPRFKVMVVVASQSACP